MLALTIPSHRVGILGMPRRMAFYDYNTPTTAAWASSVDTSVAGGLIVLISGILFIVVLVRGHFAPRFGPGAYRFSVATHAPRTLPLPLNSFALCQRRLSFPQKWRVKIPHFVPPSV
jgi:cytochrome c oxidase subunit I